MSGVDSLLSASEILEISVAKPSVRCGIYFLLCGGEVVYIGRAIDIDRRLLGHSKKDYDRWAWTAVPAKHQEAREREYLDKFLPRLNRDYYTQTARRAAAPLIENMITLAPRVRRGRITPKGCYWRGDTLWARAKIGGVEFRQTLRTDSPAEAIMRRKNWVKIKTQSGAHT